MSISKSELILIESNGASHFFLLLFYLKSSDLHIQLTWRFLLALKKFWFTKYVAQLAKLQKVQQFPVYVPLTQIQIVAADDELPWNALSEAAE